VHYINLYIGAKAVIPYKITTTIIGAIIFLIIFMLVRRGKLQEKYALAWFAIGISVVVLGLFPVIIDRIAWVTGITYPPALLFAIAVGVLLIQNLYLFILTSQNDVRIKELLQQVAVLNKLVDDLRTRDNPNPDHTTRSDSSPPRITPMK